MGGGTETYILRKFEKLEKDYIIVYIQGLGSFVRVSLFGIDRSLVYVTKLESIFISLKDIFFESIVINNLVGYSDPIDLLSKISSLKKEKTKIKFLLHDFFCICPSINMIGYKDYWCNCQNIYQCVDCLKKIKNRLSIQINSIEIWQKSWEKFFYTYIDEIIVFSKSSFDIFCRFYPCVKNKICIIPHEVPSLREVHIKSHIDINIATIGSIGFNKGLKYLYDIDNLIKDFKNLNMYIIGSTEGTFKNIKQTGKYNVEDLPKIIEELEIDGIFILSICPETFSYTTSEAISMNVPVICFDLGAQAEKVNAYSRGLVLKKISMKDNLNEIVHFIKFINKK